jgi:glycosyltransferase involved in cell wall biosynthesis
VHLVVARNLEYIYDIATAIRAFRNIHTRHPDARLTIAGSGPCRASLERLCVDLGLDDAVTFTGRLDSDQMAALYQNATILLNPSLADNMPNSLLEAMASGVPIVSTNVGGIRYLVEHEKSALLVPPGDPAAMSAAALRVIEDPCLAELLRTSALDAVKSYAWARVRAGLIAVYTSALDRTDPVRRQPSVPGDTT